MIHTIKLKKINDLNLPLQIVLVASDHKLETYYCTNGRPTFQFVVCHKGQGELHLNHQPIFIQKGSGFFINAGESYSYHPLCEDWCVEIIEIHGALCKEILATLGFSTSDAYTMHDMNYMANHIQKIMLYQNQLPLPDAGLFSKLCYDFLIDLPKSISPIKDMVKKTTNVYESDVVIKILTYLEKHACEDLSLDDLAEYTKLTKGYMCSQFKKITGRTIITELTYIRMGLARSYLIQYPEKSVIQIAKLCGYENAGYFGKVFKKITGETPEHYRRQKEIPV